MRCLGKVAPASEQFSCFVKCVVVRRVVLSLNPRELVDHERSIASETFDDCSIILTLMTVVVLCLGCWRRLNVLWQYAGQGVQ